MTPSSNFGQPEHKSLWSFLDLHQASIILAVHLLDFRSGVDIYHHYTESTQADVQCNNYNHNLIMEKWTKEELLFSSAFLFCGFFVLCSTAIQCALATAGQRMHGIAASINSEHEDLSLAPTCIIR